MQPDKIQEVIIVHPINRLKEKIRPQQNIDIYFTDAEIKNAQNSLDNCQNLREKEQNLLIQNLLALWQKLKVSPTKNNHYFTMFFIYINRLDDLSAIASAEVIQNFVKSLKHFLHNNADIQSEAHRIIIQAHLDAINLAHQHKINTKDSKDAKNLRSMLDIAIEQNTHI